MPLKLPPITPEEEEALNTSKGFEKYLVARYTYWELFLNKNQSRIGRAYLWLRRHEDMHALFNLSQEELTEMMRIMADYERALILTLARPTLINCEWLGNEYRIHRGHGHMHLTPRNAQSFTFMDQTYSDLRFGSRSGDNYVELPDHVFLHMRDTLRAHLPRE